MPVIISQAMASYLADPNFSLPVHAAMASKSDDMAYLQGTYTMTDPKTKKPMTDKGTPVRSAAAMSQCAPACTGAVLAASSVESHRLLTR